MIFETVEAEGLAHLSYIIGDSCSGQCAVIDPRRDCQIYVDLARKHSVRITHIFETHIHADFVSGGTALAARTAAKLHVGAAAGYGFSHVAMNDGDEVAVGGTTLRAIHTPGHTPEHICLLAIDDKGRPWGLFSGDTLFAGEVGRPDLLGEDEKRKLARQLYHSIHNKLLALDDGVVVYPAHGQGSPCGGSIGDRNVTSIGFERQNNPKLDAMPESDFVELVLAGLPPAPTYYPRMKKLNLAGAREIPILEPQALTAAEMHELSMQPDVLVVDAREIEAFGGAHIPGSLNIPLRDEFPVWSGWMLDPNKRIAIVSPDTARTAEIFDHLHRIGIDNVAGYLAEGIRQWFEAGYEIASTPQMGVHDLHDSDTAMQLLDVRTLAEFEEGHLPGAINVFTARIESELGDELDKRRPVTVYCGSGYRASVAAAVLERMGFNQVRTVPGSMMAWIAAGYETESSERSEIRVPIAH